MEGEDIVLNLGEKTIDQRIREIGQELIATSFDFTERAQKGEPISKEEEDKYKATKKWFTELERIYVKMNKIRVAKDGGRESDDEPEPDEKFDQEIIEKIKQKKSMLMEIRQDLK